MAFDILRIPDYKIVKELFRENDDLLVSAVHEATGTKLILKVARSGNGISSARPQWVGATDSSAGQGFEAVLEHRRTIRTENFHITELSDFDGTSLETFLSAGRFSLSECYKTAEQLTRLVEELHYHGIRHDDLRPIHFLINPKSFDIRLVDLSGTRPKGHEGEKNNQKRSEASLPYISPEQSGLTNVAVDYRSDYYHLGVIFYRLFTGKLPFDHQDANELVHAHLARSAVPPADLAGVPEGISGVIMKLLSKKPEDRYQTTRGIRLDLAAVSENAVSDFVPGRFDVAGQFALSEKLYGRSTEISLLTEAFGRVANGNEVVLVSGQSGVGKSSLVEEFQKTLASTGALFVSGKFDQYVQNVPFEGVIKSLKSLVALVSRDNREYWETAILEALGSLGQIVIDVIPELEQVIGAQPAVEPLTPIEAQNRFINVFTNFLNVFTKPENPLVIFLDDLQWADPPSLTFLSRVSHSVEGKNFLLIGAYRDNEVGEGHMLKTVIGDLEKGDSKLSSVTISGLSSGEITALMSDVLSCPRNVVAPLAELVMGSTLGNPYFVTETLSDFYRNGYVRYEQAEKRWLWDLELAGRHTKQSTSQLLTSRINRLSERARQLLLTASCIGTEFGLLILSALHDKTPMEIEEDLHQALSETLLVVIDEQGSRARKYRFAHDQVQQAAYQLLTAAERDDIHLNAGYFLQEHLTGADRNNQLYEIVNHLNHYPKPINVLSERRMLAGMNMDAGKKAKASAAYSVAFAYFGQARELLVAEDWDTDYALTFDINLRFSESAYLAGHFDLSLAVIKDILPRVKELADRIEVHHIHIQCLILNKKGIQSIEVSLGVLKDLGIQFPRESGNIHILVAYLRSKWVMRGKKIGDLSDLPPMTDLRARCAMRVLQNIHATVFELVPPLYPLMIMKMFELSLRYGISEESALTFATYGAIVNAIETNHKASYEFGGVAINLAGKIAAGAARDRTLLVYNIINRPSGEHINNSLEPFRQSYQTGIEMGDIEYCGYVSSSYSFHLLLSGKNLHWVKQEIIRYNNPPKAFAQTQPTNSNETLIQIAANLLGENDNPVCLSGQYFDEGEEAVNIMTLTHSSRVIACFIYKMFIAYLIEEYDQALGPAGRALPLLPSVKGTLFEPLYAFYFGLLNVALFRKSKKRQYLADAVAQRKRLAKLAAQVPVNFKHRVELLDAEIFAATGKEEKAIEYYDRAIKTATDHDHPSEATLANELCAKFWLGKGQTKAGMFYLRTAFEGYQEWGCVLKETYLLNRYPALAQSDTKGADLIRRETNVSIASTFDFATLMKVSAAISGEVVFGRLMKKLMHFVIENAGAQSGYFIHDSESGLFIEAQRSVVDDQKPGQRILLRDSDQIPISIVEHVLQTRTDIVLHDAQVSKQFGKDPIVMARGIRSALCIPVLNQGKVSGALYLENNLSTAVFTNERTELLKLLSGQIAVAIENAILYEQLEQKVAVRTEEIYVQKEEIERQKQLVEEKSHFKEQFFANMSHEIRTPMTAILGMSELLFDTQLTDKQTEYAKGIQYSSENLLSIINDILDYSKIEAGKFSFVNKPFKIRDRMIRLDSILRMIAGKKGLALHISVDDDVSQQLIGDPVRLHQVLLNLASNAIKFTDEGSVSLEVRLDSREEMRENLLFIVSDTGIGIAHDKLEFIFETFTRIDDDTNVKQSSGTGLGLFIAKKLVEEQGGTMHVESEVGRGTVFKVALTYEICGTVVDEEVDRVTLDPGLKILLAEDNLFNQVVAEETLKKMIPDVKVTIAENGEVAVRKFGEGIFDIILMDIKMPVMDGYNATRAIRATAAGEAVPILAFTSNANPLEAQKCKEAGMDDYITKPIEAQKLKKKIQKLLKSV